MFLNSPTPASRQEASLLLAARVVLAFAALLLVVAWLLPMPDPAAVPGRLPRAVVGA